MVTATLIGFGAGGVVIAIRAGSEGAGRYPVFVALSLLLALAFLSLAALVAFLFQRKARAFGVTLIVWFFFVVFYDLLVIGGSLLLKERTANAFIFASLFGNPVDMVRVASLIVLDGQEIFGAAGGALVRFLGGEKTSLVLLLGGLLLWIVIPFLASRHLLKNRTFEGSVFGCRCPNSGRRPELCPPCQGNRSFEKLRRAFCSRES